MECVADTHSDTVSDTVDNINVSQEVAPNMDELAVLVEASERMPPSIDIIGRQSIAMDIDTIDTALECNFNSNSNADSVEIVSKRKKQKSQCVPQRQSFGRFERIFGEETIERLMMIDGSRKRDSTFILECMRKLFGSNEQLKWKSACGRKQRSTLTSEMRKILENIFKERLSSERLDSIETNKRFSRLSQLINDAINNIIRVRMVQTVLMQSSAVFGSRSSHGTNLLFGSTFEN